MAVVPRGVQNGQHDHLSAGFVDLVNDSIGETRRVAPT
jgi:hypothetical protein